MESFVIDESFIMNHLDSEDSEDIHLFWCYEARNELIDGIQTLILIGLYPGKTSDGKGMLYKSATVFVKNFYKKINVVMGPTHDKDEAIKEIDRYLKSLSLEYYVAKETQKYNIWDLYYPYLPRGKIRVLEVNLKPKGDMNRIRNTKGNNYIAVIGNTITFHEHFLLENKIKGPTWLCIKPEEIVTSQSPHTNSYVKLKCGYTRDIKSIPEKEGHHFNPPLRVMSVTVFANPETKAVEVVKCFYMNNYSMDANSPKSHSPNHINEGNWIYFFDTFLMKKSVKEDKPVKLDYEKLDFASPLTAFIQFFGKINPDVVSFFSLSDPYWILEGIKTEMDSTRRSMSEDEFRLGLPSMHDTINKLSRFQNDVGYILEKGSEHEKCLRLFKGRIVMVLTDYVTKFMKKSYYHNLMHMLQDTPAASDKSFIDGVLATSSSVDTSPQAVYYIMDYHRCLQSTFSLAKIIGINWGNVMAKTSNYYVDWLLNRCFYESNCIIPDTNVDKSGIVRKVEGGANLEPMSNIYFSDVILIDIKSAYPNSVIDLNICFSTFTKEGNRDVIPELLSPDGLGILPRIMKLLLEERQIIAKQIATLKNPANNPLSIDCSQESIQNKIRNLTDKELAVKLLANSMYGCIAQQVFRYYNPIFAGWITKHTRDSLNYMTNLVSRISLHTMYPPLTPPNEKYQSFLEKNMGINQEIQSRVYLTPEQQVNKSACVVAGITDSLFVNMQYSDENLSRSFYRDVASLFSTSYPIGIMDIEDSYNSPVPRIYFAYEKRYLMTSIGMKNQMIGIFESDTTKEGTEKLQVTMKGIECVAYDKPKLASKIVKDVVLSYYKHISPIMSKTRATNLSCLNLDYLSEGINETLLKEAILNIRSDVVEIKRKYIECAPVSEFVMLSRFTTKNYEEIEEHRSNTKSNKKINYRVVYWIKSAQYILSNGRRLFQGDYIPYVRVKNVTSGDADYFHPEQFINNTRHYELDIDWYLQKTVCPSINQVFRFNTAVFRDSSPSDFLGITKQQGFVLKDITLQDESPSYTQNSNSNKTTLKQSSIISQDDLPFVMEELKGEIKRFSDRYTYRVDLTQNDDSLKALFASINQLTVQESLLLNSQQVKQEVYVHDNHEAYNLNDNSNTGDANYQPRKRIRHRSRPVDEVVEIDLT